MARSTTGALCLPLARPLAFARSPPALTHATTRRHLVCLCRFCLHRSDLHAEFPTREWIADRVLDAFVRVCKEQGVGEPEPVGAAACSDVDAVGGVEATGVGGVANEGPSPEGPPDA